jgi:hypothetical protein
MCPIRHCCDYLQVITARDTRRRMQQQRVANSGTLGIKRLLDPKRTKMGSMRQYGGIGPALEPKVQSGYPSGFNIFIRKHRDIHLQASCHQPGFVASADFCRRCASSGQRCRTVLGLGMPGIGHSSVPTMGRVNCSTISRVPSGSLIHFS